MISIKVSEALSFCLETHKDQLDKAGLPYAAHPIRVSLSGWIQNEEAQIVALLHDVVEDHGVSLDLIRDRWGNLVADGVDAVSRRKNETYKEFIERCSSNKIGRMVKLADLEDNTRPERVLSLPEDQRDITKRYEKAKKVLVASIYHSANPSSPSVGLDPGEGESSSST